MTEWIAGHQTPLGLLLALAAALCGAVLLSSYRTDPRNYRNIVILDAGLILLVGSISMISRNMLGLQVMWRLFAFLVVPLMAVIVGILLVLDGIVMLRREGPGRSTLIPLASGGLIIGIMPLTVMAHLNVIRTPLLLRPVMALGVIASFFSALTFLTMETYGIVSCRMPKQSDCDYIIVHGCAVFGDRLTPLLRGRVDKAAELYQKNGGKTRIVVSGGRGPGETISEAEAMRRYLCSLGIPEAHILLEDSSTSTRENLLYVRNMTGVGPVAPRFLCVTSDYHALRTAIYARKLGMNAVSVGSRTALYYRPSAAIREYIALMVDEKWLNLVLLGLWILLVGRDVWTLTAYAL